jgi:hypothetical protein
MINLGFGASTREHTPLLVAGLSSLLSLLGCATDSADLDAPTLAAEALDAAVAPVPSTADDAGTEEWVPVDSDEHIFAGPWSNGDVAGGTINLNPPKGNYIAKVKANGTGCPVGTSKVSISEGGQYFLVEFPKYELQLSSKNKQVVQECIMQVDVETPDNYQFAVSKLLYGGDVDIGAGVQMRVVGRYWFQGDQSGTRETERQNQMMGPAKQDYMFAYTPERETLIWSPCGKHRNLNVYTRLQLLNGTPAKGGYANLGNARSGVALGDDSANALVFGFAWRKCKE